jgi:hypothetical protein
MNISGATQYYTYVLGQGTEDLSTLRAAIADVHATSDVSNDDARWQRLLSLA